MFFMSRYKCKCGDNASWYYVPYYMDRVDKDNYYCDICVERSCSCNRIDLDYNNVNNTEQYKDELGRHYPCIEYSYLGFPGSYGRSKLEDLFIICYYSVANFIASNYRKLFNDE